MGHTSRYGIISRYGIGVEDVPPEVISNKKKKTLYDRWANPEIPRSQKDERAAVARYWGGWEEGSGMVFDSDVWQRNIHVIKPLWADDAVPDDWTKWRSIDYGSNNGVNVCAWWAVGPKFAVLYRLLYERGLEISDLCEKIIRMSNNERVFVEERRDSNTGNTYEYWEERQRKEVFWGGTLLDPRSAGQAQQGQTLADIFLRYGIMDVRAACGQHDAIQIPRLKDWLRIDYSKLHPFNVDTDWKPRKGCPRLFFFDGKCGEAISEIEGMRQPDPDKQTSGIMDKRDPSHFIDSGKYWASDQPVYMGDEFSKERNEEDEDESRTAYTGY